MSNPKQILSQFTDAQLLEELARRYNNSNIELEDIRHWCHDCGNFKPWNRATAAMKNYNPCTKKHAMKLYVPKEHDSPEYGGFYLLVCTDRKEGGSAG